MVAGASILIVEDDGLVAMDLEATLGQLGYRVVQIASSAEQALAAAAAFAPDLVLMDIHIKGARDGIDAAAQLRARFGIPVVYLTAYADADTVARAKETAPLAYLHKPISDAVLRSTVEIALHRSALERRLREHQRWFATTLRSIGDAVISVDPGGRVTFSNAAAQALTGWTAAEASGRPLDELVQILDEVTREPLPLPVTHALQARSAAQIVEGILLARDGRERPVSDSAAPIIDDQGQLLGAVMVLRDLSEHRKDARQLELASRMASLGTLAAGVAHEINNPLTFLSANLRFSLQGLGELRGRLAENGGDTDALDAITQALQEALLGGERITRIVSDLKLFSRPQNDAGARADPARAIAWAVKVTAPTHQDRARITVDTGELPAVTGDEARLGQVLVNLICNAAQAIAPGAPERNQIRVVSRVKADGAVLVEVHDTGSGIPPELLGRIFDPFFTTKEVGHGSGLGLSICHDIVKSMGGTLSVTSEPGRGSCFSIRLPPAPQRAEAAPPGQPPVALRRLELLVIDDEPLIGRVVERMLKQEHAITRVESAQAALGFLQAGRRFDVILCDLMMPGMNGIELHAELSRALPEQAERMIFMSGGAVTAEAAGFLERMRERNHPKPIDWPALRALIRRRIEAAGPLA